MTLAYYITLCCIFSHTLSSGQTHRRTDYNSIEFPPVTTFPWISCVWFCYCGLFVYPCVCVGLLQQDMCEFLVPVCYSWRITSLCNIVYMFHSQILAGLKQSCQQAREKPNKSINVTFRKMTKCTFCNAYIQSLLVYKNRMHVILCQNTWK